MITRRAWLLGAAAVSIASCTRKKSDGGAEGDAGTVSLKGSDTMVILGQRWAEEYMKLHPKASIQVTGGGSGTGIAALINGTTDICQASRPMKDSEKADLKSKRNAEAVETRVALDALAVYVHEKNPLEKLSIADLRKVYDGSAKSWSDVGGGSGSIVLYGRENNSGTYGYFKEHVLDNKDFATTVQTLGGTSAVVAAVKGDPQGIGYGGIAYAAGVKALKIQKDAAAEAITPSLETAQSGAYPLARFLYFYTAGEPKGPAKAFLDYVLSAEGQRLIESVGYYPLPKSKS
ncbi:MAG: phosphate ABC transporter substrate-binding protein [Polyangiaceae bacterium]